MPQLRLHLDGTEQLEARLTQTTTRLKDTHLLFKRWVIVLYASIKQNFAAGGRPDAWPAPQRRNGRPLRDTGRLMASVTGGANRIQQESHSANTHVLELGTNLAYANAMQFGVDATQQVKVHTRRGRRVKGHTRQMKIAPRPFLLLQDEDRAALLAEARKFYFGK